MNRLSVDEQEAKELKRAKIFCCFVAIAAIAIIIWKFASRF